MGVNGLYLLAANGSPRARAQIKAMTVEGREAICPPGLRGRSRRAFVLYGLTFEEQIEGGVAAVGGMVGEVGEVGGVSELDGAKADVVGERKVEKVRVRREDILRYGKMTSASVARAAGIDGRKFRDYLRAMGLSRQFRGEKDAMRAVRAYREWEDRRSG